MLKLLIKTIGLTFYRQHVGLFLVMFYLLFGMIKGYDLLNFHKALLISICSSPLNLGLLLVAWALYALKCVFFVKQKLALAEHQFVQAMTIMPRQKQYVLWAKVYAFLWLPILAYSIALLLTAIIAQYYFSLMVVLLGNFLLIGFLVFYTFRFSNFTFQVPKKWLNFPTISIHKAFWFWPIAYLLQQQLLMLLVCKVVSLLSFKAVLWVFADVGNDIRVYLTALLAVVFSHAILIFNLVKFDAFYLGFAKSLPIPVWKRFGFWLLVFGLLLIPEFVLLMSLSNLQVLQLLNCLFFSIATMLALLALLYLLKADMERYMKYLLFFFFVSMLAILGAYYFIFSLLLILFTVVTFFWRYNSLDLKEIA